MNLLNMGMGEVRPYLKVLLVLVVFAYGQLTEVSAQVDVKVVVIEGFTGPGIDVEISMSPFDNEVEISYDSQVDLQFLTVLTQSGQLLYYVDISSDDDYTVLLSPGTYTFKVQSDSGTIIEQVVVS